MKKCVVIALMFFMCMSNAEQIKCIPNKIVKEVLMPQIEQLKDVQDNECFLSNGLDERFLKIELRRTKAAIIKIDAADMAESFFVKLSNMILSCASRTCLLDQDHGKAYTYNRKCVENAVYKFQIELKLNTCDTIESMQEIISELSEK